MAAETTFVVLAAGRGTRTGRYGERLHKSLLPLDGKAVLSHILDSVPSSWRKVVVTGHLAPVVRDYVEMVHADDGVELCHVEDYNAPGSGPGESLLRALPLVHGNLVFVTCDTLWGGRQLPMGGSWVGVAPMPAGTEPERWCRIIERADRPGTAWEVFDKTGHEPYRGQAFIGIAGVAAEDLREFVAGVRRQGLISAERQLSGGLRALAHLGSLQMAQLPWTDVGDADSYVREVVRRTGYDTSKPGQATYVLPRRGVVVKFDADLMVTAGRTKRAALLGYRVAQGVRAGRSGMMMRHRFVEGQTFYELAEQFAPGDVASLSLNWITQAQRLDGIAEYARYVVADEFYRLKTLKRVEQITDGTARNAAGEAVRGVDWGWLHEGFVPAVLHGDAMYDNLIFTPVGEVVGIDWRCDFAGHHWGDLRYDVAKLLAGTVVHWGNARNGVFDPWEKGTEHRDAILQQLPKNMDANRVQVLAALCLINSAPLHAEPLGSILVERACAWLRAVKEPLCV